MIAHRDALDTRIAEHAKHWRLSRMAAVDRNVLRLAVYELEHGDTPASVILDEAVELARRFGDDPSPAFVNGVLDAVARSVRGAELHEAPRRPRAEASSTSPERERDARDRARAGADRARARRSRDRLLRQHRPAAARCGGARRLAAVRPALAADRRRPRRRPRRRGGPAARRGRAALALAARAGPRPRGVARARGDGGIRARCGGARPRVAGGDRRARAPGWRARRARAAPVLRGHRRGGRRGPRGARGGRGAAPPARRRARARLAGARDPAFRAAVRLPPPRWRCACRARRRAGPRSGPRPLAAFRARGRLPSSNGRAGRSSLSRAVQERATCARRCSGKSGARALGRGLG